MKQIERKDCEKMRVIIQILILMLLMLYAIRVTKEANKAKREADEAKVKTDQAKADYERLMKENEERTN